MLRCAVCQTPCSQSLCQGCQTLLKPPENPCQICAKPLNQPDGICGECRNDKPAFSTTYCAAIYQAPVDTWVQQLKFGDRLDRARIMAESLSTLLTDVDHNIPIIPVPLHPKRLRKRGYNQAFEVAKIICKQQNRPLLSDVLVRTKNTKMQAELHEKQRAANVRAAFELVKGIDSSAVILLDDVMTTGQTLRSVSNCLVKAGVNNVIVAVFSRSG